MEYCGRFAPMLKLIYCRAETVSCRAWLSIVCEWTNAPSQGTSGAKSLSENHAGGFGKNESWCCLRTMSLSISSARHQCP